MDQDILNSSEIRRSYIRKIILPRAEVSLDWRCQLHTSIELIAQCVDWQILTIYIFDCSRTSFTLVTFILRLLSSLHSSGTLPRFRLLEHQNADDSFFHWNLRSNKRVFVDKRPVLTLSLTWEFWITFKQDHPENNLQIKWKTLAPLETCGDNH